MFFVLKSAIIIKKRSVVKVPQFNDSVFPEINVLYQRHTLVWLEEAYFIVNKTYGLK